MANATTNSFFTQTKNNQTLLNNPLTGKYEAFSPGSTKIQARKVEILEIATAKLGRPPTETEFLYCKTTVDDDRTSREQIDDSDFRPVLQETESNLQGLLTELDEKIETERISKLSPTERRRHDIQNIIDRETENQLEEKIKNEYLEKIADKLNRIEQLTQAEAWNPNASEKLRGQLRKAKQQLLEPTHCPVVLLELTKAIDATLVQRQLAKQDALDDEAAKLGQRIAAHQQAVSHAESLTEEGDGASE